MSSQPTPAPQEAATVTTVQPHQRRATLDILDLISETEFRQQYAKDLVSAEIARDAFDQDWRLARVFATSGIFEDIKGQTPDQAISAAMAKIQMGRSWGIGPADSMQFIYFQKGKPSIQNEIIASKMRQAGYDWDIDWRDDTKKRCVGATVWLKRWNPDAKKHVPVVDRNGNPVSQSFTLEDAQNAMIWDSGKQIPLSEKWNYKSWPQDMYFWRCIARLKRYHATDVLCGAKTAEEVEEMMPTDYRTPTGSAEAAAKVGEEKVRRMKAERGLAEGETQVEHDARIERQMAEQLEAAKKRDGGEKQGEQTGEQLTESGEPVLTSPETKQSPPRRGFGGKGA